MRIANDSFLGWTRFALARDFVKEGAIYNYPPTLIERSGRALRHGIVSTLDLLLREIKNPITIVALTSLAALAVTIVFYPAAVMKAAVMVLPLAARLEPWMLKMALYILVQTAVLGVGLRAYGRFQNQPLMDSWKNAEISPLFIGAQRR